MKNRKYTYSAIALLSAIILIWSLGCTRDFDELELATFPTTPEIFIDGFSQGLNYAAFGGSKVTAFDVDKDVRYEGSASMKIEVPDAGDPMGAYAGGVYYTNMGRDLTGYTALTFWAKASKSATIALVGFGNDLGESKYLVSITDVAVNTNWQKYIIPIPDATKLTQERGMFYFSEGPEDGRGYTIWFDEVKFENLGTIAHKQPQILNGNDNVESAVNGLKLPVTGLSVSFNMPTGIDQTVIAAPAYYAFTSSNASVATVDTQGWVTVLSAGTSVISATLGGADADGSLTVQSSGDFTHAPAPTKEPEKVISIFSNAYTNVPVDFFNGYWQWQTTTSADFTVGDDDVLVYANLNFVGIQFTSPTVDASNMTHLHMDVWIPNAVSPSDRLAVKVVDLGADGAFGGTDPSITYEIPGPLVSQSWISVDISLSGLSSKSRLAQIILENLGTQLSGFYLDNIYFYGDGGAPGTMPEVAAPTPPARDGADVISIYGDAYTNLPGTDYPFWGQVTVVSDVAIEGNNTLKFAGLNYQGIQLAASQNVTEMQYLHLDFWTANSTALKVFLISLSTGEEDYTLTVPTTGWSSVDIPLSEFSPVNLADIHQFKFEGNGDIYLDNLYFYKTGGGSTGQPTAAAPTPPVRDADDVISLFSNAYANKTVDSWSAVWDDSDVADLQVAGDDVKKYTFTYFAGIDFSNHKFDASGMTNFHLDIWTPNEVLDKSLTVKLVDFGGGTLEATNCILTVVHTTSGGIPALATGAWVSIDVPVTAFSGNITRSDLAQIVLSSDLNTVYIDNLYLYKTSGGTATEPTAAAPTPPARDAADVVSVFSGAYADITGTDFNPNWNQTTVVTTIDVAGNSTLKYANFNYQGTVLAAPQNLTEMGFLHVDMWTSDATVVQVTPINNSGSPTEKLVSLTPISAGQWKSYDIPLTEFTSSGMTLNGVYQMKFDGQAGTTPSTIYLDNIYFYKGSDGGGGDTGPTAAAPTPPARDAANVVSIYSDAYAPITIDNFDAGWCGADAVTEVSVAGNNTLKKNAGIGCHGIDFSANRLDLSTFTHIHFDLYTDDTNLDGDVFNVKLVDFAGGSGGASALEVNINTGTTPKIVAGEWVSVDINITALGGVVIGNLTRSDVAQFGITTANLTNVWYDNIYLYK